MSERPLAGRTAIVTGSSRGMGVRTAYQLAMLGASTAVSYVRSKDLAEELASRIAEGGGTAQAFQADLTEPDGAASLVAQTVEAFGRLDILVCNVGGFLRKPFEETTFDDWRWQFAQNTDTMFLCIQAALPHLKESGAGRIVNLAAAGAEFPVQKKNFTAYASAKAAVVAMTRALAHELAEHAITVNCISPGIVSDNAPTREEAVAIGHVKHTPVGRVGSAQDIADAVAFLVRPEADYITGAVLEVGGGWRL
ncbi:MAG TPA: SDR family NAD(P)-dependent oxidoreductase [Actinomycetota bacterium]|nr:SDR family NAD(P)-dependent oxidoreductase [Actinomycetota bacterium]